MPRDADNNYLRWERALQHRGVASVRLLLRIGAGHDADMALRTLVSEPPYPPRNFVENWLADRDSSVGWVGQRIIWPALMLIAAVAVVGVAIGLGIIELPKLNLL